MNIKVRICRRIIIRVRAVYSRRIDIRICIIARRCIVIIIRHATAHNIIVVISIRVRRSRSRRICINICVRVITGRRRGRSVHVIVVVRISRRGSGVFRSRINIRVGICIGVRVVSRRVRRDC